MAKKQYLLVNIEQDLSKLNGSVFWRLTFLDLDDYSQWETAIDPSYRNFTRSNWDHVVYDTEPFGIYEGLIQTARKTLDGTGVLTADSYPAKIACVASHEEIMQVLESLLQASHPHTQQGQQARHFHTIFS
jgi:hypothetical protein